MLEVTEVVQALENFKSFYLMQPYKGSLIADVFSKFLKNLNFSKKIEILVTHLLRDVLS